MSFKRLEKNDEVVLRRFNGVFHTPTYATTEWLAANAACLKSAVVVDLETTGLDASRDKIIEIALRPVKFDRRNGHIVEVGESYSSLEDPQQAIPSVIIEITGITDDMVRGQAIDWPRVGQILGDADLILAHHAEFERSFLDPLIPPLQTKVWACSLNFVDWNAKGFAIQKLEVLSTYHGFYVDAHRALNDVDALIHLLMHADEKTQQPYLNEILEAARLPRVKILATGAPFESKDALRGNGYHWNAQRRVWWKSALASSSNDEVKWMEESVYFGAFRGWVQTLRLCDTFKSDLN
jgi:DNA polymerase-3 subunit epsilon